MQFFLLSSLPFCLWPVIITNNNNFIFFYLCIQLISNFSSYKKFDALKIFSCPAQPCPVLSCPVVMWFIITFFLPASPTTTTTTTLNVPHIIVDVGLPKGRGRTVKNNRHNGGIGNGNGNEQRISIESSLNPTRINRKKKKVAFSFVVVRSVGGRNQRWDCGCNPFHSPLLLLLFLLWMPVQSFVFRNHPGED